jgi:hypothetical protein
LATSDAPATKIKVNSRRRIQSTAPGRTNSVEKKREERGRKQRQFFLAAAARPKLSWIIWRFATGGGGLKGSSSHGGVCHHDDAAAAAFEQKGLKGN